MSRFSEEQSFLNMMKALVAGAAKNHNTITRKQLDKAFEGMNLSDEQMQMVMDYLRVNNIGVDEPLPVEEVLTEEEHNYLQDYEEMVAAIPMPTPGELDAIKLSSMAGEKDAQKRLIEASLSKVIDIARLYAGQGVMMEDLIGAGNEALVRAVTLLAPLEGPEEVDGDIGARIMKAMEDVIAENIDAGAEGNDAAARANEVMDKAQELAQDLGRKVTPEELAAEGDLTLEEIMDAIRLTGNAIDALDYQG